MGLQIKYARLRRKRPSELVAERAGISRATLVSIEKGSPSVAMGCYAAVRRRHRHLCPKKINQRKELLHRRLRYWRDN